MEDWKNCQKKCELLNRTGTYTGATVVTGPGAALIAGKGVAAHYTIAFVSAWYGPKTHDEHVRKPQYP